MKRDSQVQARVREGDILYILRGERGEPNDYSTGTVPSC